MPTAPTVSNRVGYFRVGELSGTGIKGIRSILTTDNFVFVLSNLENLIKVVNQDFAVSSTDDKESAFVNTGGVFNQKNSRNTINIASAATSDDLLAVSGDAFSNMAIKCQSAVIPGLSNAAFDVNLHGFIQRFRGRREFTRSLSITYLEDSNVTSTALMRAWFELISGTFSGTGFQNYKVEGVLYVFKPNSTSISNASGPSALTPTGRLSNIPAAVFRFINLFPQNVDSIQLSGENSGPAKINVTFVYDHMFTGELNKTTGMIDAKNLRGTDHYGQQGINIQNSPAGALNINSAPVV